MSSRLEGEEKHAKKSSGSEYDGEIKIDHSDKKPAPEPPKPPVPEPAPPPKPVEQAEPTPVPEDVPEPVIEIPPPSATNEDKTSTSSVLVPGGVKDIAISPANYFSSKYKKHSSPHRSPVPQTVFGATTPPPAPQLSYNEASYSTSELLKNKFVLIGVLSLIPILGVVSYIFGIYIPNKPENTYSTAMDRTGKGLQSIFEQTTQSGFLDKASSGILSGELQYIEGNESANGIIQGEFSKEAVTLNVVADSLLASGESKQYTIDLLATRGSSELYPSVYIKANDYKLLQLDELLPNASSQKNKWLEIDGDYASTATDSFFSSVFALPPEQEPDVGIEKLPLDYEELSNFTTALIVPLREYMFNTDQDIAIFGTPVFSGEEEIEGVETYKYSVNINLDSADALCAVLANEVAATSVYQKVFGPIASSLDGSENDTQKACSQNWLTLSQTTQPEIWIDKDRKVLHKVRFSDQSSPETFREFGQLQSGDELRFFSRRVSSESQTSRLFVFGVNLRSAALNYRMEIIKQSGDQVTSSNLVLTTTPSEVSPIVSPPEGAVKLKRSASQSSF